MKYSISLQFMWADLPFADRVRKAASHGFDQVDLWGLERPGHRPTR